MSRTPTVKESYDTVIMKNEHSDTESVASNDSKKKRKARTMPDHEHRCCALLWNCGIGHERCTRPRQNGEEESGLCKKHLANFKLSPSLRHADTVGKTLGTYLGLHSSIDTGKPVERPSGYHKDLKNGELILDFEWKDADESTKKIYKKCRNIRKEATKTITQLFGKKSKFVPETISNKSRENLKKILYKELKKGYDSKIYQFMLTQNCNKLVT